MTKIRKKIGNIPINTIKQDLQSTVDASVAQMQQDVNDFIDEETAQYPEIGGTFEFKEDPEERSEVTTDSEGRVISYRDSDGVKYEKVGINSKEISTNSLKLSDSGMTEFQQDLKNAGFKPGGHGDWSENNEIYLPLPTNSLPIVNITTSTIPSKREDSYNAIIEFNDLVGNYFKKEITGFGIQGRTTAAFPKKNFKFDFVDCKIKFGNLVMQDSFHLKANYADIIRGKSNLAYDYFLDIISYNRSIAFSKPWIARNIIDYNAYGGKKNENFDFSSDARGVPAGFAIKLFINGNFYGIYTWNIKKHRDNYAMDKKNAKHIHLDPDNISSILSGQTPNWEDFEIRNPKNLIDINGNSYDGDNPTELTGDASVSEISATVKQYIINFSTSNGRLYGSSVTKEIYEAVYDPEWIIDFTIFQNVLMDGDGVGTNTQYCTWDGIKWYPMPYDLDQIFGNQWKGNYISRVSRDHLSKIIGKNHSNVGYNSKIFTLYDTRFKERYKELRDSGIISVSYIIGKIKDYIDYIGKDLMQQELSVWTETPCYRKPKVNDQWEFMGENYSNKTPTVYSDEANYEVGDVVTYGWLNYHYMCKKNCSGIKPYDIGYVNDPIAGGFFDSIERMEIWLTERITFLDSEFNYIKN